MCAELVPYGAGHVMAVAALVDRPDSVCRAGTVRGWSRDGIGTLIDRPDSVCKAGTVRGWSRDGSGTLIDRPDSVCRAGTVRGWSRDGSANTDRPSRQCVQSWYRTGLVT